MLLLKNSPYTSFGLLLFASLSFLLIPGYVYAATPGTFRELVELLLTIFNSTLVPLIFAFSLLAFLWGVFQYMFFPTSEERKTKGRKVIVWGVIVFVVMVSLWGIVNLGATLFRGGLDPCVVSPSPTNCPDF